MNVTESFERNFTTVLQASLQKPPEEMLGECLRVCIDLSNASGGSILAEEGPYLQFLFSNVPQLIGVKVPWESIAGTTARHNTVIYTYAPADKRHFEGVDQQIARQTRYLLSIPIPSVHSTNIGKGAGKTAGVLQLLFDTNILPTADVSHGPTEFSLDSLREQQLYKDLLQEVFWLLPHVAFGLEVMRLRQTSYQVIHELKNKLIAAQSWVNCLKQDLADVAKEAMKEENIIEDLDLAETAAREGADLAKSYLQFTKIYTPRFQEADVSKLLVQTVADVRAFAAENGGAAIQVVAQPDPAVGPRTLDPEHIRMALFNLGKNAVEALVGLRVENAEVRLISELAGERLRLLVKDNGPGMPEEIANNLFVAFKTKKQGGTGLGLTITKKIVDVHGGTIRCETGKSGTCFVIEI